MSRINDKQEAIFSRGLGERSFGPRGVKAPVVAIAAMPKSLPPALGPEQLPLGDIDGGGMLGMSLLKLVEGRLLIQGVSGAGKSYLLRRLVEQAFGRVPQIIADPEGEFSSLAETLGIPRIECHRFDGGALAVMARRVREHSVSLVLDLSELDREGQMKAIASFLNALIEAPREHWHPMLVAIDEAHLFAPFGGDMSAASSVRKAAINAVTDLMSRGRKRGLTGVLATQRLARLAKSVASEVHNFLVGMNTLDLDIKRASETIGWDNRRGADRLPLLKPGQFIAVGPAFSRQPAQVKIGPCRSRHIGASPALKAPSKLGADEVRAALDLDGLIEASEEAAEILGHVPPRGGRHSVRAFLRDEASPLASRLFEALIPLAPDGALVTDLARHLGVVPAAIDGAVALLEWHGAVEFRGEGLERAARIVKPMLPIDRRIDA
ncbi:ATP-binding protein [Hypericibacter sp.]|uniref:ATP-binding protein n=1 Tax=Hypericibacter sp. TaxID=2705401 RepID=UPI003D6D47C2